MAEDLARNLRTLERVVLDLVSAGDITPKTKLVIDKHKISVTDMRKMLTTSLISMGKSTSAVNPQLITVYERIIRGNIQWE